MQVKKVSWYSSTFRKDLVDSFQETGFAVLMNPPIDPELISKTYAEWKQFFERSIEEKMRYGAVANSGYIPPRKETAKGFNVPDLKEMYHYYLGQEHEDTNTRRLRNELFDVASRILSLIEDELFTREVNITMDTSLSDSIQETENSSLLRILHYPPLKIFNPDELQGAQRAAPHEDINLISLLVSATNPGLEVQDLNGKWHPVDAASGDLILNAGDMLQEATGGYFKSTTHRVISDAKAATESRYSMPFFLHPRPEVVLSNRYTAGEYLDERLRELGLK